MTRPVRLQLFRRRGFNLQAASIAANRLPVVNVARPSKWGNPFRPRSGMTPIECVEAFRDTWRLMLTGRKAHAERMLAELSGKNLACWCKPGAPCHADVLLDLANPSFDCREV